MCQRHRRLAVYVAGCRPWRVRACGTSLSPGSLPRNMIRLSVIPRLPSDVIDTCRYKGAGAVIPHIWSYLTLTDSVSPSEDRRKTLIHHPCNASVSMMCSSWSEPGLTGCTAPSCCLVPCPWLGLVSRKPYQLAAKLPSHIETLHWPCLLIEQGLRKCFFFYSFFPYQGRVVHDFDFLRPSISIQLVPVPDQNICQGSF